jgi:hypothetical protein
MGLAVHMGSVNFWALIRGGVDSPDAIGAYSGLREERGLLASVRSEIEKSQQLWYMRSFPLAMR